MQKDCEHPLNQSKMKILTKRAMFFIMDELLTQLEMRLRMLKQQYEQLEYAHLTLKQRVYLLQKEKDILLSKNKIAIAQIENMVLRLKSIERTHV